MLRESIIKDLLEMSKNKTTAEQLLDYIIKKNKDGFEEGFTTAVRIYESANNKPVKKEE